MYNRASRLPGRINCLPNLATKRSNLYDRLKAKYIYKFLFDKFAQITNINIGLTYNLIKFVYRIAISLSSKFIIQHFLSLLLISYLVD